MLTIKEYILSLHQEMSSIQFSKYLITSNFSW